ncbi:MAG: DUF2459 domain-containing protein [Parvibaculaceae bacterium]
MLARAGWRRAFRFAARLLAALVVLIVLYLTAALGFALFPASSRPHQTEGEPAVYVCTSLAHADILLPSRDPLVDWNALFPAAVPPGLSADSYLAFGWGDLRFFREVPSWADVRLSIALGALAGRNDTALRVIVVNPPTTDEDCRLLRIDRAGRQALIDHIRATLAADTSSGLQPQSVAPAGREAYYPAKGRYSPLRTCNQWVADGLAAAGLPHALFAPFSFGITWPLATEGKR